MINSNQLLLIIVLLICIPTVLMSANPDRDIAINTKAKAQFNQPTNKTDISDIKTAFGLNIGDNYYDLRVKLPHYNIETHVNEPIIVKSGLFTFELDLPAKSDTDKYRISNDAKITKISRLN